MALSIFGGESLSTKQKDSVGIIFTYILFCQRGESNYERAYISLKYPFLAIHAKGGESISPKQKDRTTTNFQNLSYEKIVK